MSALLETNELLAALILPWAKEKHPEKYAGTLKVAANPATLRRYLIRLIEIRWADPAEDTTWRGEVPLSVLEDSAIQLPMRHVPTGETFQIKGRLAPGPRVWTFAELASFMAQDKPNEAMAAAVLAKQALDLEHVP